MKKILLFLFLINGVSALDLDFQYSDVSFNRACSYYTLSDIPTDITFRTTDFYLSSTKTVYGNLGTIYIEYLDIESYQDYDVDIIESCKQITLINTSKINNCSYEYTYNEIIKYKNVWKRFDKTIFLERDKPKYFRVCGSYQPQYFNGEWRLSIDHIPNLMGVDYKEFSWWNFSYFKRYCLNISYTGVYPTHILQPITVNVSSLEGVGDNDIHAMELVYNDSDNWTSQVWEWFFFRTGGNGQRKTAVNDTIRFRVNLTSGIINYNYCLYIPNISENLSENNNTIFAFYDGFEVGNFNGYTGGNFSINSSSGFNGNNHLIFKRNGGTTGYIDIGIWEVEFAKKSCRHILFRLYVLVCVIVYGCMG